MDQYRRLFQDSPAPMYLYEQDSYAIIEANEAALHLYGYSRADFMSLSVLDMRPVEDRKRFVDAAVKVSHSVQDFGRWRHLKKNGEAFHVQIFAHKTTFNGKKARVVMALDVEDKVSTERILAQKESDITTILESVTDAFFTLDLNWNITYFNRTAERVLCRERQDVLGKNLWELFPQAVEKSFYPLYHNAMAEKITVHFEEYYAPLDIWVSVNVYPSATGLAIYFLDITDQKKVQQKILKDELNLRAIINTTCDVIWSMDRENNLITANEAFWARVKDKGTRETLSDKRCAEYLPAAWNDYFRRAFSGEHFRVVWKDPSQAQSVFEELRFNPIIDHHGEISGISCFARDITEQQAYLEHIRAQNLRLKEIYWIQSHEVRSPLSNIMGLIELFGANKADDPDNQKIVEMLRLETLKFDAIIKRIGKEAESGKSIHGTRLDDQE